MERVENIHSGRHTPHARRRPEPPEPVLSRALVVVESRQARPDAGTSVSFRRSNSAYLAHLIATAAGVPQTRERRRLDPQEGAVIYGAVEKNDVRRPRILRSI